MSQPTWQIIILNLSTMHFVWQPSPLPANLIRPSLVPSCLSLFLNVKQSIDSFGKTSHFCGWASGENGVYPIPLFCAYMKSAYMKPHLLPKWNPFDFLPLSKDFPNDQGEGSRGTWSLKKTQHKTVEIHTRLAGWALTDLPPSSQTWHVQCWCQQKRQEPNSLGD